MKPPISNVNLWELAKLYCKENNIELAKGIGKNNGLEIRYSKQGHLENLSLTKFHSPDDLTDYQYVHASKKTEGFYNDGSLLSCVLYVISSISTAFKKTIKKWPEPEYLLTKINYVALSNKRFYEKFKQVPDNLDGQPYSYFLKEMNAQAKRIENDEELMKNGINIMKDYMTTANQEELKKILDKLIQE